MSSAPRLSVPPTINAPPPLRSEEYIQRHLQSDTLQDLHDAFSPSYDPRAPAAITGYHTYTGAQRSWTGGLVSAAIPEAPLLDPTSPQKLPFIVESLSPRTGAAIGFLSAFAESEPWGELALTSSTSDRPSITMVVSEIQQIPVKKFSPPLISDDLEIKPALSCDRCHLPGVQAVFTCTNCYAESVQICSACCLGPIPHGCGTLGHIQLMLSQVGPKIVVPIFQISLEENGRMMHPRRFYKVLLNPNWPKNDTWQPISLVHHSSTAQGPLAASNDRLHVSTSPCRTELTRRRSMTEISFIRDKTIWQVPRASDRPARRDLGVVLHQSRNRSLVDVSSRFNDDWQPEIRSTRAPPFVDADPSVIKPSHEERSRLSPENGQDLLSNDMMQLRLSERSSATGRPLIAAAPGSDLVLPHEKDMELAGAVMALARVTSQCSSISERFVESQHLATVRDVCTQAMKICYELEHQALVLSITYEKLMAEVQGVPIVTEKTQLDPFLDRRRTTTQIRTIGKYLGAERPLFISLCYKIRHEVDTVLKQFETLLKKGFTPASNRLAEINRSMARKMALRKRQLGEAASQSLQQNQDVPRIVFNLEACLERVRIYDNIIDLDNGRVMPDQDFQDGEGSSFGPEKEEEEEVPTLCMLDINMFAQCHVSLEALLDSGSTHSLIIQDVARELGCHFEPNLSIRLDCPEGTTMWAYAKVKLGFSWENTSGTMDREQRTFFIVPRFGKHKAVLPRNFMRRYEDTYRCRDVEVLGTPQLNAISFSRLKDAEQEKRFQKECRLQNELLDRQRRDAKAAQMRQMLDIRAARTETQVGPEDGLMGDIATQGEEQAAEAAIIEELETGRRGKKHRGLLKQFQKRVLEKKGGRG